MSLTKAQLEEFKELNYKIKNKINTREEADRFAHLLLLNGSITQEQYNKLVDIKQKDEDIINILIGLGGIALLAYMLNKKKTA